MQKLLLTSGLVAVTSAVAFAQGKVRFENDSLHLVYLTTDTSRPASGNAMLAGVLPQLGGTTLSGVKLVADLFAGTSSTSLRFQQSTTFSATTFGTINSISVILGIIGAETQCFQAQIRDQLRRLPVTLRPTVITTGSRTSSQLVWRGRAPHTPPSFNTTVRRCQLGPMARL
jgi:hypothetical protein